MAAVPGSRPNDAWMTVFGTEVFAFSDAPLVAETLLAPTAMLDPMPDTK